MDKKVLVVEDSINSSLAVNRYLTSKGYDVYRASGIEYAMEYLEETQFACLISDLDLSSNYLKKEEIFETRNNILTGWVWIKNYLRPKGIIKDKNIIIYSAYINELNSCIKTEEIREITLINKNDPEITPIKFIKIFEKVINR